MNEPVVGRHQRQPRPRITYGRQTRPLPLNGRQFKRVNIYDIPLDDHEEPAPRTPARPRREPAPEDSPLSEDELEAVYGRHASPVLFPLSSLHVQTSSSKTSNEPTGAVKALHEPDVPGLNSNSTTPAAKSSSGVERPRQKSTASRRRKAYVASVQQTSKTLQGPEAPSKAKTRPKLQKNLPATRLPVNELLFVASQPDDVTHEPRSSSSSPEARDLISSSSDQRKEESSSRRRGESAAKIPLTSIRKRLKTPKFTHKSVVPLRQKLRARTPLSTLSNNVRNLGDGFEISELSTDGRPRPSFKRSRNRVKPLHLTLEALHIQSGPVPEVKFEASSTELEMELPGLPDGMPADMSDRELAAETVKHCEMSNKQTAKIRFNFSDLLSDEAVRAQLSSISAPKRAYSISSNDSEEDFVVTDDEESETNEPDVDEDEASQNDKPDEGFVEEYADLDPGKGARKRGSETFTRHRSSPRGPTNNQRARQSSKFCGSSTPPPMPTKAVPNPGVTLDFRKPSAPGTCPRTPFGKRRLMEVNEPIQDVPDIQPQPNPLLPDIDDDEMLLDVDAPDVDNRRVVIQAPQRLQPRPILRRNTPLFQTSGTDPEHTGSNTRRNSVILAEDSRYFTAAADMLNSTRPPPRITRHRSSQLRAEYLARQDVQILDSEAMILETSPQPSPEAEYRAQPVNILKRNSDAMWTSSRGLPQMQDLRTLTRTVSNRNGTLSQAVRRRPTLPFQSPTKVRVV